jgi:DNA repair exonuclease SbcCD ATPase subunit
LEELIDSKPTARGQVLTRFMGLDFLKRKEEIAKTIYSDFSKSMLSNIYNTEELKSENLTCEEKIEELKSDIETTKKQLEKTIDDIKVGNDYRDEQLRKKHSDIDIELSRLNPSDVQNEIDKFNFNIEETNKNISDLKIVEPSEFYKEEEHDKVKEEYKVIYEEKVKLDSEINQIEKLKSSVSGGALCQHCGIDLMNASITQSRINELDGYINQKEEKEGLMHVLTDKEQGFTRLKKEFDEYEKNKLIKEKYELTIDSYKLKIENLKTKLTEYDKLQSKIKENERIDTMLIKAKIRLDELDLQKRQQERVINENENQITNFQEKIKNNLNNIIKISEEQDKEKIHKIYLEAYGKNGISKIIMKTMMPLINSELQRLMEDSGHFRLEIRINDKNEVDFIMIDNSTGIEKLMSSGSGYERTIASLALRSVLSKICSLPKPNVIVFDEVFGKISNDNLDMVSEFFIKIKEYFEKIFVITHNPMVSQWADNVVKVKKIDNISHVSQ